MQYLTAFAIYFVVWWITLFAILPIGLRTQAEDGDVAVGTVASAPARFRGGKIMLMTTLVSAGLSGIWYAGTYWLGVSLDDLPRIVPRFD
jgi:predicted secreted protein